MLGDESAMDNQNYGGGGFMQGGDGNGFTASPSVSQGGTKKSAEHSLIPLTVLQLKKAKRGVEDGFIVDGRSIGQIKILGRVEKVTASSTKITYAICDLTGMINVTHWIDNGDDSAKNLSECREGVYVRVIGDPKEFNDAMTMTVFHISPIVDYNEITHHILEVTYTHLHATRGSLDKPAAPAVAAAPAANHGMGGTTVGLPVQPTTAGGSAYSFQTTSSDNNNGMSPLQNTIYNKIKGATDESGTDVRQIITQLAGRHNEAEIRETLDFLSNEGHIYSTIDDDHFRSTEDM